MFAAAFAGDDPRDVVVAAGDYGDALAALGEAARVGIITPTFTRSEYIPSTMMNRAVSVEEQEMTGSLPPLAAARDVKLRSLVDHFGRVANLSPKQLEVVKLAVSGIHRKECAAQLSCSLKTIEGYWRRIFEKTQCRSDAEVVAMFIRQAVQTRQAQRAN